MVALQAAIEVVYNYENKEYRGKGKSSEHNAKHMAVLGVAREDALLAAFPRLAMRQKVEMLSKEIGVQVISLTRPKKVLQFCIQGIYRGRICCFVVVRSRGWFVRKLEQ